MRNILMRIGFAALTCVVAIGCDPGGPGAEGTISLDSGVDATGYATLELRAFPEPEAGFDVASGVPADGELYVMSHDIAEVEFPYGYLIGGGVGTTEFKHWRVLAWLAEAESTDVPAEGPASGEWYGTTQFVVDECGGAFGDYCSITNGVDFTIDTQAP